AEALHAHGVALGPRQVRRYLKHLKAGYRRTASTVGHKQDPVKVARALAILADLRAKAEAREPELFYLDESGFAPSLPTGYSWCLPGQRKRVKYEYPQGRRVNVLAAYRPDGAAPRLGAQALERTLNSDDLLDYLRSLPGSVGPRVVVLDNASLHVSKVVKAQRRALAQRGIYLYYLPAYSPELNRIEPVFRQVKYQEIPVRSYTSKPALREAVEHGFDSYAGKVGRKSGKQLRPAAKFPFRREERAPRAVRRVKSVPSDRS
ncbi:MAG TPA: IS630 family transposase, partial [Thermoanaerobaculia bacterium]|nr:IS630 family transposase [Thermoanaerobaculia bacterium]